MYALLFPTRSNAALRLHSAKLVSVPRMSLLHFRVSSPFWYSSSARHSSLAGCASVVQSVRALGLRALCITCSVAVQWRASRAAARLPRESCFSLIDALTLRTAPSSASCVFRTEQVCTRGLPSQHVAGVGAARGAAARALKVRYVARRPCRAPLYQPHHCATCGRKL